MPEMPITSLACAAKPEMGSSGSYCEEPRSSESSLFGKEPGRIGQGDTLEHARQEVS